MWYFPETERLSPGKATFQDVLDVLGPPDDFCTETGDEEVRYPTILRGTFTPRPMAEPETPEGSCWLWIYTRERVSQVDLGVLVQIALLAIGSPGSVRLVFGTDRDQAAFIRARLNPKGVLEEMQISGPPETLPLTVNPFQ